MHEPYPVSNGKLLEYFKKHWGFIIIIVLYMVDFKNNLKNGFGHGVRMKDR